VKQVALQLFHGQRSPDEDMDNWGTQGPVFLVDYVHVTYRCDIKLGIPEPAGDGDLRFVDDLVFYDGVYYGDWSVFRSQILEGDQLARVVEYDASKATPPDGPDECSCCRHYRGTFECGGVDCQRCENCNPD
jgi:hypothetical protein